MSKYDVSNLGKTISIGDYIYPLGVEYKVVDKYKGGTGGRNSRRWYVALDNGENLIHRPLTEVARDMLGRESE